MASFESPLFCFCCCSPLYFRFVYDPQLILFFLRLLMKQICIIFLPSMNRQSVQRSLYTCIFTILCFAGVVPYPNQTPQEEIILEENTQADFSLQLKSENNQTIKEAASVIEIKMSESGKYYDACRCRWLSKSNAICKNQRNVSICETDNYEMRFSLLVKRSYRDIIWELYRTDCTPLTLKKTKLQVTCKRLQIRQLQYNILKLFI